MKSSRKVHAAIAAASILGACGGQGSAAPETDADAARADVARAAEGYMQAVQDLDASAVAGFWAPDGILMSDDSPGLEGRAEVREYTERVYPSLDVLHAELGNREIEVWGDVAMEITTFAATIRPKDGRAQEQTGRYLFIWKRQPDGSWKIWRGLSNSPG